MKTTSDTQITKLNKATTTWFRDAAPYIHAHRNATFVIAFDGETIACANFDNLIHDLALLNSLGVRLVLAFGARPQIEQQCLTHNINIKYHQGLRITDESSLKIVKSVIGKLRIEIEAKLTFSLPHTPMADAKICCASGNWVIAQPVGIKEGIDFRNTGKVRRIDTDAISQQLNQQSIVLLPPLGYSPTGEIFNLSYESIATATAMELAADKLIFIGDELPNMPRELTVQQAENNTQIPEHILAGTIQACHSGVQRVHLLNRTIDGALLQELFSRDGIGTLISANAFESTRQATIEDVSGILELIQPLEQQGILVKRSREHLEMEIEHFTVMERDGKIIACAALYFYPKNKIAELACLAVDHDYQDHGRGKHLLSIMESQALSKGFHIIYLLTTQTAHWFVEHGFKKAQTDELPVERLALYNYQRNAKVFSKRLS